MKTAIPPQMIHLDSPMDQKETNSAKDSVSHVSKYLTLLSTIIV